MNVSTAAASSNESSPPRRSSPMHLRRAFPRRPTLTLDGNGNLVVVPGVYMSPPPDGSKYDHVSAWASPQRKGNKPVVIKKILAKNNHHSNFCDVDVADEETTSSMCTVSTAGETWSTTSTAYSLTPTSTCMTTRPCTPISTRYNKLSRRATIATSSSPVVLHQRQPTKSQQLPPKQQPQHMPLMNFSDFLQGAPLLATTSAVEREKQALSNEEKAGAVAATVAAAAAKKQTKQQQESVNKKQQQESKSQPPSKHIRAENKVVLKEKLVLSKKTHHSSSSNIDAQQKQPKPTTTTTTTSRHMPLMNLSDISSSLCPNNVSQPVVVEEEQEEEDSAMTRHWKGSTSTFDPSPATKRQSLSLDARGNLVPTTLMKAPAKKENEQNSHQQQQAAGSGVTTTTKTTKKASLSSVQERRESAQQWYARFGRPSREDMKRRIAQMKFCGIAARDVDLLPWTVDGSTMVVEGVKIDDRRDDHHRSGTARRSSRWQNTPSSLIRSTSTKISAATTSESSSSSPSVPWAKVALKKTGIKVVVEQPRDEDTNKIVARDVHQSSHKRAGKLNNETTDKGSDNNAANKSTTCTPQRCRSSSVKVSVVKKEAAEKVVALPKAVAPKCKIRIVDNEDAADDDDDDSDKSIELTYSYVPRSPRKAVPINPIVVVVSKHHDTKSRAGHDSSKHDRAKSNKNANSQRNKNQPQPQKSMYLPPSCKLLATGGRNKVTISRSINDATTNANAPSPSSPRSNGDAPNGLVLTAKGDLVSTRQSATNGVTTEPSNNPSIGTATTTNPWARVKLKKTTSTDSPAAFKDMMRRAGKSSTTSEVGRGGGALW